MGYARRVLRLVFDDPDLEGFEVRVRPLSVGQVTDLGTMDKDLPPGQAFERYLPAFVAALVDWNLEEPDGTPVPATLEGLRSLDIPFATALIRAWTAGTAGLSPPLAQPSPSGQPSAEPSIPMEVLSSSPSS